MRDLMRLAELAERHVAFIEKTELIPHIQPSGLRHRQLFRHQHRACVVDHNIFFHVTQLAGIIVRAANVIAVPALRHGITGNTSVGEQRGLIKYFKVLEFLCSCVYSHLAFLPFFFGNGKHTTHLPQSLLKHLLSLRLLRKGRVQAAQQAELCFVTQSFSMQS